MKEAVRLRLVSHRDSPNGHRGGTRDESGNIKWAYGIDLSPLGTRFPEFLQIAEAAAIEAKRKADLRRRLTIARKSIAQLAQTALEYRLNDMDWLEELAMARLTTTFARGCRDIGILSGVVAQIELRKRRVHAVFTAALERLSPDGQRLLTVNKLVNNAPTDASTCTDSTTTIHTDNSEEKVIVRGERESSSAGDGGSQKSAVEIELDRHGIDIGFIGKVCNDVAWELQYKPADWSSVIAVAQGLAAQTFISGKTWSDACRIMGKRGASAAVIATVHKEGTGAVRSAGAYLQGMTNKAMRGELRLSRTFYAIRDEHELRQTEQAAS